MPKKLPLHDTHKSLSAKIAKFAGYLMPISYSSIVEEHLAVRKNVGIFDISHMGEFLITGEKAFDLVQKITANDISKLYDGKAQYSYFPNEKNGIVDDLLVYRLKKDCYMLVINAINIEKDWKWISQWNEQIGAEMKDISDETCLFSVQGPKSINILQNLFEENLTNLSSYTFIKTSLEDIKNVLISRTGYTGAGGFELYVHKQHAVQMWKNILLTGKKHTLIPIGLAARDTLRLEMGFCLYGNEIDETTSPFEAGLGWITKFTSDFVNSSNLKKQISAPLHKLIGFEMLEKGIPRKGYSIFDKKKKEIGKVTSGNISPILQKGIGMGYVQKAYAIPKTPLLIKIRKAFFKAVIKRPPFVN